MKRQIEHGDIYLECTLTFKGKVSAQLYHAMCVEELVDEIISCGDYEYEVIDGDFTVRNIEVSEEYDEYDY